MNATSGEEQRRGKGSRLTRMTVNVHPSTSTALETVVEREGVTVTEALRRLVAYGHLMYRTTQIEGDDMLIRRGDDVERIIVI